MDQNLGAITNPSRCRLILDLIRVSAPPDSNARSIYTYISIGLKSISIVVLRIMSGSKLEPGVRILITSFILATHSCFTLVSIFYSILFRRFDSILLLVFGPSNVSISGPIKHLDSVKVLARTPLDFSNNYELDAANCSGGSAHNVPLRISDRFRTIAGLALSSCLFCFFIPMDNPSFLD
jgi:hypothetical protein